MKNIFNSVKLTKPGRNKFDLSHDVKMSGKMGNLMPVLTQECIPGDSFSIGANSLLRFAPILAPIMHKVDVSIHYFFVPNRLTWANWEKFIVGDPSTPVHPFITTQESLTSDQKKFLDYMGVPPLSGGAGTLNINALPFAAYQRIYNEYYRDQNLITATTGDTLIDGDNAGILGELLTMRKRAYEHDYFTASLPFAQKGTPVSIPLGDVELKENWDSVHGSKPSFSKDNLDVGDGGLLVGSPLLPRNITLQDLTLNPVAYDPDGSLQVGATTISRLREAFSLQRWLERNALGGTRYIENILVHFGVKTSDKRLQRPEYITGVKAPVVISEVLNSTGPTEFFNGIGTEQTGSPQGDMAGHAVAVTTGKAGSYYVEEHGYIIGIMSIMPKTAYQQGCPKHYQKSDYLDYAFPEFAHLGEQPVLNSEIYVDSSDKQGIFGYLPRYAEYRYNPSRVAGDFRTSHNFWHLGRIFTTDPALNQQFIECDPVNVERIFAVQDGTDNLWIHLYHQIHAVRPLPLYGTPS